MDGSNRDRIAETKAILDSVVAHKYIAGKRILVLVNKQDQAGALTTAEVGSSLGIHPDDASYCIKACSAVDNESSKPAPELNDGFKWLLSSLLEDAGVLLPRIETETEEWREVERAERKLKRERVRKNREERERKQAEAEAAAAAGGGGGDDDGGGDDALAAKQATHEANIAAAKAPRLNEALPAATAPPAAVVVFKGESLIAPADLEVRNKLMARHARKQTELGSGAKKKTRRKKKQKPKKNQIVPADEEDLPHANINASEA